MNLQSEGISLLLDCYPVYPYIRQTPTNPHPFYYIGIVHSVNARMINEYRAVAGMRICRGNGSTWKEPAQFYICFAF